MPRLIPQVRTGPISSTIFNILVIVLVAGFLLTVTLGGFLVWAIGAVILAAIVYGIIARLHRRWIGGGRRV